MQSGVSGTTIFRPGIGKVSRATTFVEGQLLPSRVSVSVPRGRAECWTPRPLSRSARLIVAARDISGAKARSYLRVQPTPQPAYPLQQAPWYVKGAAAVIGAVTLLRIIGRLRRKGSIGELENRGLIDEDRNAQQLADDPFYNKVMKNMNTVAIEELSTSQIEAARKRRLRERDTADGDIEKIDLPENHPFAVKKKVSKEEEELIKARLAVKRGLPLQDLQGTRGLPEEAYRRAAPQQR